MRLVYFSSGSGNTKKFIDKVGYPSTRIPIRKSEVAPQVFEPYVLVTPCYADGMGNGSVPKQVIAWLNDPENRKYIIGVIGGGNRNFGHLFANAANVISNKCHVPVLYKFELAGDINDVERVQAGLVKFFDTVR